RNTLQPQGCAFTRAEAGRPRLTRFAKAPMTAYVNIQVASRDGSQVVMVNGEVDHATVATFVADVLDSVESSHEATPVILDFSGVQFCGAAGLSALVRIEQHIAPRP